MLCLAYPVRSHGIALWPSTLLLCLPSPPWSRQPRFPFILPASLPSPWTPLITDIQLNFASFSGHLTMNRSTASRTPRYHLPAFYAAMGHSAGSQIQTPTGSVPWTPQWVKTLCEVVNCSRQPATKSVAPRAPPQGSRYKRKRMWTQR